MTKPIQLLTCIPFEGFYNSIYSAEIDRQEEQHAEHHATESDGSEAAYPEALRLNESEICDALFHVTDYRVAHEKIAHAYCDAFAYQAGQVLNWPRALGDKWTRLPLTFESLDSPKEYNFETDRIFAHIPLSAVKELFARSKAEGHETLKATIRDLHSSRSGFISYYENELSEWLAKPLRDWDHNELQTLVIAVMTMAGGAPRDDDFRDSVYYATCDDGCYSEWESAVDWAKYDERVLDARLEKLEEFAESDPDALPDLARQIANLTAEQGGGELWAAIAPHLGDSEGELSGLPLRCTLTVDMFEGRAS